MIHLCSKIGKSNYHLFDELEMMPIVLDILEFDACKCWMHPCNAFLSLKMSKYPSSDLLPLNSTLFCISSMISDPPINSPFMYNCGKLDQLEYVLRPSRVSLSVRILKLPNSSPSILRISTAFTLKPHQNPSQGSETNQIESNSNSNKNLFRLPHASM